MGWCDCRSAPVLEENKDGAFGLTEMRSMTNLQSTISPYLPKTEVRDLAVVSQSRPWMKILVSRSGFVFVPVESLCLFLLGLWFVFVLAGFVFVLSGTILVYKGDFVGYFRARRGAATKSLTATADVVRARRGAATADVAKFAQTHAKKANESQEKDQESSHFDSQKPLVVTIGQIKVDGAERFAVVSEQCYYLRGDGAHPCESVVCTFVFLRNLSPAKESRPHAKAAIDSTSSPPSLLFCLIPFPTQPMPPPNNLLSLCHSHPAPIYLPPRTTTPTTSTLLSCSVIFRFYLCFGYSYLYFVANFLTGHFDHSTRVMRVITWNQSLEGYLMLMMGNDDFDSEEHETHATMLDNLLAWEKLYDEVKGYDAQFETKEVGNPRHKKRGTNSKALKKAKAAVSHLHKRGPNELELGTRWDRR
ncbi:hypothetical protein SO802_022729 [Lithocarpus litseifolius]|uniref:DUF632 domain-containing protein n=1 Tax=Lithocarpus litseifolius TaxID=425828 RepID=A0AAW2C5Q6_9ROSI